MRKQFNKTLRSAYGAKSGIRIRSFFLLFLLLVGVSRALAQDYSRRVVGVVTWTFGLGPVIQRPGATSIDLLKPGDKIRVGDVLYTGIDGNMAVSFFGDKSQGPDQIIVRESGILRIAETESSIQFDESKPPKRFPTPRSYVPLNVKLYLGRMRSKAGIGQEIFFTPSDLSIDCPGGITWHGGVRGTHAVSGCQEWDLIGPDTTLEWVEEFDLEGQLATFGVVDGPSWRLDSLNLGLMDEVYFYDSVKDYDHLKWYWGLIAEYRGVNPFELASDTTPISDPVWVHPGEFFALTESGQYLMDGPTQTVIEDLLSQPFLPVADPSGMAFTKLHLLGAGSVATYFAHNIDEPPTALLLLVSASLLSWSSRRALNIRKSTLASFDRLRLVEELRQRHKDDAPEVYTESKKAKARLESRAKCF